MLFHFFHCKVLLLSPENTSRKEAESLQYFTHVFHRSRSNFKRSREDRSSPLLSKPPELGSIFRAIPGPIAWSWEDLAEHRTGHSLISKYLNIAGIFLTEEYKQLWKYILVSEEKGMWLEEPLPVITNGKTE